jgi:hypothetical protein
MFGPGSGMKKCFDPVSGSEIKHPGSATLPYCKKKIIFNIMYRKTLKVYTFNEFLNGCPFEY